MNLWSSQTHGECNGLSRPSQSSLASGTAVNVPLEDNNNFLQEDDQPKIENNNNLPPVGNDCYPPPAGNNNNVPPGVISVNSSENEETF